MTKRFLRRPISGERKPAGFVFGEFRDGLFRFLLRKLRDAERAEDLTQEVYLRLLRTSERTMVRNPQAYVFGVAFNVLSEFKLHEAQSPIDYDSQTVAKLSESLADKADSPEEIEAHRDTARWLENLVARLSPMQQVVLLMAKRQGLAHAEIAAKLGISIGTVRKHLARAITQCRKAHEGA